MELNSEPIFDYKLQLDRIRRSVTEAVADGYNFIVLSDRAASAQRSLANLRNIYANDQSIKVN